MIEEAYVLHITKLCNCKCLYCYETDKTSTYTWEGVREYIDNLLKYAPKTFHMEFLGGEPMLNFDLIIKTVEYLTDWDVHFTISTNGTILTDEQIQWLKDQNGLVNFAISVDGPSIANAFRLTKEDKSTWPIVVKNVRRLLKAGVRPLVHMVSHPYNIAYLADSIDWLYKLGFRSIAVGTVEKTIRIDSTYCERYVKELDLVSQRIAEGKYPNIMVNELESQKPESDVKNYIRDKTGKVIGETYGRVPGDISDQNVYEVQHCTDKDEITMMILDIRRRVYELHQKRMEQKQEI